MKLLLKTRNLLFNLLIEEENMEKLPSKIPQTNFEDFEPIIRLNNSDPNIKSAKVMNINIGVLGHIDSGKTSLCKALSTIASTAGFDKNP
jgi:polynucleotide 5'-kinase involved in rRNA processing